MKTTNKVLSIGIAIVLIAFVLFLAFDFAGPAFSATLSSIVALGATPTPLPGDKIPLKPIPNLTSLNATANIQVNGLINGKRTQGDLNAVVTTNDQNKSKISVSGSLLGDIVAQVGGSMVSLFTPKSVDIYKMPDGAYIVLNSFIPVCVKPADPKAAAALDEMSPQGILAMLTSSDVARGKLVGTETLKGVAVNHYIINGDTFLTAARNSSDPKTKAFGEALWSAKDANLYVDSKGGYPVAFNGSYSGTYEPLKFEGDFNVDVALTGINTNTAVDLPSSCNNPISR